MGRRYGKTIFGLVLESTFAVTGGRCAWVVPAYKNGYPLWQQLRNAFGAHKAQELVRIHETERRIEIAPRFGGGYIGMYSGDDDCDAIRGEAFDLVVIDEAAKLSERAIYDAILPTLADRNGKLVAISTPRGRNWFWREWNRGQDMSQTVVRSFTAPSNANPMPQIQQAFERAKTQVSERTFRQEWLAEFVDDGGGVFRGVRSIHRGSLLSAPTHPARRYVMGVDLAKMEDFTVCCVIDELDKQVVAFDRFNKASWPLQKQRIYDLAKRWNDALVWIDATGVGDPIYDDLRRAVLRIQPYKLTNSTKEALIDNAVLLVEQQQVHFPAELVALTNELESYEYERTAAGVLRMNAPSGEHDDCVISFALACWPLGTSTSFSVSSALDALSGTGASITNSGGVGLLRRVI